MTDVLLRDDTRDHDGAETRTVVYDIPAPWLLHGLFRSDAYVSHTAGVATSEVALATDDGYAVATIGPTDGVPPGERSFDDFFSGGEVRVADKASATFRSDVHDVDAVIPSVNGAAERARGIRSEVDGRD